MSRSVYTKLALTNLKNNRKTYVPYVLTAIVTVMMYYILCGLASGSSVGDRTLQRVLEYSLSVVVIFSVLFLFYTNSFLMKRRKKEIGVYNILGLGKQHIAKMLTMETLVTASVSIAGGILAGLTFEKLMYLCLQKLLRFETGMKSEFHMETVFSTAVLFFGIFALTLCYNLLQIRLSNPSELLRAGKEGEKEPRTKWVLALVGTVFLGIGYCIALTTESPLEAIPKFFLAVICVIIGTYALFIAGSIAFLKFLKGRKRFYYQTKHFVSVSGMIYRMKQNGAGLANICILSTIVLVMISATASLYLGIDDVISSRYPRESRIKTSFSTPEQDRQVRQIAEEVYGKYDVKMVETMEYHYGSFVSVLDGERFLKENEVSQEDMMEVCQVYLIPLEDYNQMEGMSISLAQDEMLVYVSNEKKELPGTLAFGERRYHVIQQLKELKIAGSSTQNMAENYYVILPDMESINGILKAMYQDSRMKEEYIQEASVISYTLQSNLEGTEENCKKAIAELRAAFDASGIPGFYETRQEGKEGMFSIFGGLLFIGIYLGILFLMATVLIIYYKQISEGYEDRERYQIMQKVGMSKKEVRDSIKSQVLLVFFLPLGASILHITVAFKVLKKLLAGFGFTNTTLFLGCTVAVSLLFVVFYIITFAVTAREYYKIVE